MRNVKIDFLCSNGHKKELIVKDVEDTLVLDLPGLLDGTSYRYAHCPAGSPLGKCNVSSCGGKITCSLTILG